MNLSTVRAMWSWHLAIVDRQYCCVVMERGIVAGCSYLRLVAEVMWSFCLSFCKQDNWWMQKWMSTKLGSHGQGSYGITCGFRITFSSFSPLQNRGFFRHLLAFLIQLTADLYITWQNDWRRQDNASTTFPGTDPTDICIWINLKIWITSRSLSVKLWHWQRFVLSGCSQAIVATLWETITTIVVKV